MAAFRRMAAVDMCSTTADRREHGKPILHRVCLQLKPVLLLLGTLATVASAQEATIHRCIGANGEPTFSDQKCAQSGLSIAPPRADQPITNTLQELPPMDQPIVTQTCATTPAELRERALAAFAASNGVGFSGLFLWDGYGYGSSVAPLKELATMIGEPLISIELDSYANAPDAGRDTLPNVPAPASSTHELVIRTMAEGERRVPYEAVRQFELAESRGCWWLRLP